MIAIPIPPPFKQERDVACLDQKKFITEAEYVHSSSGHYSDQFEELQMRLGIDSVRVDSMVNFSRAPIGHAPFPASQPVADPREILIQFGAGVLQSQQPSAKTGPRYPDHQGTGYQQHGTHGQQPPILGKAHLAVHAASQSCSQHGQAGQQTGNPDNAPDQQPLDQSYIGANFYFGKVSASLQHVHHPGRLATVLTTLNKDKVIIRDFTVFRSSQESTLRRSSE